MRVLAIETTGAVGSFAIVRGPAAGPGPGAGDETGPEIVAETNRDILGRHVEMSVDIVREVLDEAVVRLEDLDGLAVSLGPGSFTGLRVGLGIAKGLCVGAGLPLAGVPTLDCLARPLAGRGGMVATARDARRGEIYCSLYRPGQGGLERLTAYMSLAPEDLIEEIQAMRGTPGERVTLVGDAIATYGDILLRMPGEVDFAPEDMWNVKASVVGAVGLEHLASGLVLDMDSAEPIYVRPSEAERMRKGLK